MTSSPLAPTDDHYKDVVDAILGGDVVPFIGAGVNLCGYAGLDWDPEQPRRLPLGGELAAYLAKTYEYPLRKFRATCTCHEGSNDHEFAEIPEDLLRVSQYVEIVRDRGRLNKRLASFFSDDYDYTAVHRLIAKLPARLSQSGMCETPHLLVVTTNYDNCMERAFKDANEPFDLLYYMVAGQNQRGQFQHKTSGGKTHIITDPIEYLDLSLKNGSVIFKIHGTVDRPTQEGGETREHSFMITENDYIDYLAEVDLDQIPVHVKNKLVNGNFLFLGYSLRDWNLRALLRRIWKARHEGRKSWSIQHKPEKLEVEFWGNTRHVTIHEEDLSVYTDELWRHLKIDNLGADGPSR